MSLDDISRTLFQKNPTKSNQTSENREQKRRRRRRRRESIKVACYLRRNIKTWF
jgi:hypothetical protein